MWLPWLLCIGTGLGRVQETVYRFVGSRGFFGLVSDEGTKAVGKRERDRKIRLLCPPVLAF